ncbi:MAG: hypothetical protein AABZ71_06360 [Candidatus Binatota bacterium]|jgi:hypothetical protein
MESAGEALRQLIASWAGDFGYLADHRFSFRFPEVVAARTPTYNPDCVWFENKIEEPSTAAIFEIDEETSRKHCVGGASLANVIALKYRKRLRYFAIVSRERDVARTAIEILRTHLGEKWALEATVIPSFEPGVVRQSIEAVIPRRK